jgi:superfamily I DNA and/or RNA helicase
MLTRARRGIIVVGNKITLLNNPIWKKWIEWCQEHNVIVNNNEVMQNFEHQGNKRDSFTENRRGKGSKKGKLDYYGNDDFDL